MSPRTFSPSSPRSASVVTKARENVDLLASHLRHRRVVSSHHFDSVCGDLASYDAALRAHADIGLDEARVVEIGYGARPYRLTAALRRGVDALGIDMDAPVLSDGVAEYVRVLRANGVERAVKTFARRMLLDRIEARAFEDAMRRQGWQSPSDSTRYLVGDAATLELPADSVDLVYSEDVFEHIDRASLPRVLSNIATWIKPTGVVLVRPNIFTGIIGGHLIEWDRWANKELPVSSLRSEPWEHLRRSRFSANTFLNRLTRADYRVLFSQSFEVVDEQVKSPGLGAALLTRQVRSDLGGLTDDELLSNQVMFVLRPIT